METSRPGNKLEVREREELGAARMSGLARGAVTSGQMTDGDRLHVRGPTREDEPGAWGAPGPKDARRKTPKPWSVRPPRPGCPCHSRQAPPSRAAQPWCPPPPRLRGLSATASTGASAAVSPRRGPTVGPTWVSESWFQLVPSYPKLSSSCHIPLAAPPATPASLGRASYPRPFALPAVCLEPILQNPVRPASQC